MVSLETTMVVRGSGFPGGSVDLCDVGVVVGTVLSVASARSERETVSTLTAGKDVASFKTHNDNSMCAAMLCLLLHSL